MEPDGLSETSQFDELALSNTEKLFSQDTGIQIPKERACLELFELTNPA